MPILHESGACVGLVDAESWTPSFFDDPSRLASVARFACDLASEMPPCREPAPSPATAASEASACGKLALNGNTRHFCNGQLLGLAC